MHNRVKCGDRRDVHQVFSAQWRERNRGTSRLSPHFLDVPHGFVAYIKWGMSQRTPTTFKEALHQNICTQIAVLHLTSRTAEVVGGAGTLVSLFTGQVEVAVPLALVG